MSSHRKTNILFIILASVVGLCVALGGLFKIIICVWLWIVVTVFFSQHPLPGMSVWASSISAAILMAGFIAYSGD